jgi:hypothetical protein
MTTKTIEHNGTHFTVTFDGEANTSLPRWSATVSYLSTEDGGPDLSAEPSATAYPTAAIEAFVSACAGQPVVFNGCNGNGCDSSAWEVWTFCPASVTGA